MWLVLGKTSHILLVGSKNWYNRFGGKIVCILKHKTHLLCSLLKIFPWPISLGVEANIQKGLQESTSSVIPHPSTILAIWATALSSFTPFQPKFLPHGSPNTLDMHLAQRLYTFAILSAGNSLLWIHKHLPPFHFTLPSSFPSNISRSSPAT